MAGIQNGELRQGFALTVQNVEVPIRFNTEMLDEDAFSSS